MNLHGFPPLSAQLHPAACDGHLAVPRGACEVPTYLQEPQRLDRSDMTARERETKASSFRFGGRWHGGVVVRHQICLLFPAFPPCSPALTAVIFRTHCKQASDRLRLSTALPGLEIGLRGPGVKSLRCRPGEMVRTATACYTLVTRVIHNTGKRNNLRLLQRACSALLRRVPSWSSEPGHENPGRPAM